MRLEKTKVYSLFLGRRIPPKNRLEKLKQTLFDKIYNSVTGGVRRIYLTKEQVVECEKKKRRHNARLNKLGKVAVDEKEETDAVNFVYTTLTTEGVPVTKEDARLAYKFNQKNVRSIRDENLRVALDMIKGLRFVKESKNGLTAEFMLQLHKIIMAEYREKNPGRLRDKQAYIYLKNYEKAEEIGFRPPSEKEIKQKLFELVTWYNSNVGKLNAIELAALLHVRFYIIHPFVDGNKRVSRLLLNKALFDSDYPLLNVSKDSQPYFDSLIKAVEKKDEKQFVEFVFQHFIEWI